MYWYGYINPTTGGINCTTLENNSSWNKSQSSFTQSKNKIVYNGNSTSSLLYATFNFKNKFDMSKYTKMGIMGSTNALLYLRQFENFAIDSTGSSIYCTVESTNKAMVYKDISSINSNMVLVCYIIYNSTPIPVHEVYAIVLE